MYILLAGLVSLLLKVRVLDIDSCQVRVRNTKSL